MVSRLSHDAFTEHPEALEAAALLRRLDVLHTQAKQAVADVFAVSQELGSEFRLDARFLEKLLEVTKHFYSPKPEVVQYLKDEAQQLAALFLREIPGCVAVFGTGYPFYSVDQTGQTFQVAEIGAFIDVVRAKLQMHMEQHPQGWSCPACQRVNKLPNLKTFCKPCDLTPLKPRDMLMAIPDLDIEIVVDSPSVATEALAETIANEHGYLQSDNDILRALLESNTALHAIAEGRETNAKVPIDLHIWDKQAFEQSMQLVAQGQDTIQLIARSLHATWEDNPFDFWFDFLFSLTDVAIADAELAQRLQEARSAFARQEKIEDVLLGLSKRSPRAERLMQEQAIRALIADKLARWAQSS